MIMTKKIF